jgi:hypothetical protein
MSGKIGDEEDEEVQNWMRRIYNLLTGDIGLAYSYQELLQALLGGPTQIESSEYLFRRTKFERALDVLVEIGALDQGRVGDKDYYTFLQEFDTNSWRVRV